MFILIYYFFGALKNKYAWILDLILFFYSSNIVAETEGTIIFITNFHDYQNSEQTSHDLIILY